MTQAISVVGSHLGPLLSENDLTSLLRGFYDAYRSRFDEVAPVEDPPVPLLTLHALDLVLVNGGRALHFFFTTPDEEAPSERRVTRLHDVSLWPPETHELKSMVKESPEQHREQVRRTAEIVGPLYVHFVVWPEDGALMEILREVAARVADREVRRAAGEDVGLEEPSVVHMPAPTKTDADDWFRPAP